MILEIKHMNAPINIYKHTYKHKYTYIHEFMNLGPYIYLYRHT
jgi:hypothetical protein